jgi:predicted O-methyltransferase YrrM
MKTTILIATVLAFFSCANNTIVTDIQAIRFGSGGGFTGAIIKYELSADGALSTINNQDTIMNKKIAMASVEEIMTYAEALKSLELNEPENMYQFIEIDFDKSSTNKLVWGIGAKDLPVPVDSLYSKLNALLK